MLEQMEKGNEEATLLTQAKTLRIRVFVFAASVVDYAKDNSCVAIIMDTIVKQDCRGYQTLPPRAQCIVHLHSKTPLCMATLMAEGCQSVGGNAQKSGAEY